MYDPRMFYPWFSVAPRRVEVRQCANVYLPGDVADTLLCNQDPAYDVPLPCELNRWENEGGAS